MDLKIAEDVAEKTLNQLMNSDIKRKDPIQLKKTLVHQRWEIIDRLGSGGFGLIYKAYDKVMKDMVAIKVEKRPEKSDLKKEVSFYSVIERRSIYAGLPKFCPSCRWFGKEDNLELAVFDIMGPSLSDLFYSCGKKFSLKTVLMLADQMIERLGYIHQCGLIHGDVKPGNFVIGNKNCDRSIYVIDFGLSSYWCDQKGDHIPFRTDCAFKGTYRYASINSHFKIEQSRRDDLESLGYVLIYFLKGRLPWQNLKMNKNERRKVIGKHKQKTSLEELTENLPTEFYQYMGYVRKLQFAEIPDYVWLRSLFRNCMWRHRLNYDYAYDWNQPQQVYFPNYLNLNNSLNPPVQINNNYNNTRENKDSSPKVISISTTDNNNEEFKQYYPMEFYSDRLPPIISPSSSSMTVLSPCTTLSYPYAEEDIQNTFRNNNLLTICETPVYVPSSPPPVRTTVYQIQNYTIESFIHPEKRKKRKFEDNNNNDIESSYKRLPKYPKKC